MNFSFFSRKINGQPLDKILFDNLKWSFALEVSNIGIWDHDATTNTTSFSKESANILGYKKEELEQDPQSWNNLVHEDDKEKYFADFKDHLFGRKDIYENISRVRHKNGSYRWILDKGKVIEKTADDKVKRVIGVHVDITDMKKKEDTISESLDLITRQNSKLKNFAHIATHNLKEHSGNFENLLEFYKDASTDVEKEMLIKNMETVSNSFKKTIDNLREIVSINSINDNKIESINLRTFVENSIKNLEVRINYKNVKIINDIASKICIEFNLAYLESIIQNLLSNALKYSKPNNYAVVQLRANDQQDKVLLSVEDNGVGIDLNAFGNDIFGLYRTFHKNKDAEGVGLYITKNQLESLGGKISVESEVNKGTKFILEFPKKSIQNKLDA
ncbi:PAS domain S-box-containing protein [Winogradskyella wandonensis]|uniref:histidine kinase n=1 Tax=Winogradskyella wandonensis TaxID=1442586 RepID=A0A4R1KWL6_9FLAO|nr:PAS domain-containing sensor histidine kinase [Winogradskyella wandonensis]TCK69063.1 PAS domain S-box-containing protein [Winogradskyella wandonensis]